MFMMRFFLFLLPAILNCSAIQAQTARMQLIHNSPDSELAAIDVYLNGILYEDDFTYHKASAFSDVGAESTVIIGLAFSNSTGPADIIATYNYTLVSGSKNIFVINGAANPNYQPIQPLSIYHFDQALEAAVNPSATTFTFFNGSMDCGTADLHETELIQLPAFEDIGYGNYSEYLELFTADYELTVLDEAGLNSYASYAAPFADYGWQGQALTIVSSDFVNQAANLNGEPLSLWAASAAGGMMTELPVTNMNLFAQVQFINNSPDAGAAYIDLNVNGNVVVNDLQFRYATSYLNIPAGQEISVEVLTQNGMPLPNPHAATFSLISGERYIMIASGIAYPAGYDPAISFELLSLVGAKSLATNPDEIEFCFVNGSTDAGDVDLNEIAPGNLSLINNAQYGEISPYLALSASDFVFTLTNAAGAVVYEAYEANFSDLAGSAFALLTSGFLQSDVNNNGEPIGLWIADSDGGALTPLIPVPEEPVFAQVQFIHTTADELLSEVDLYVNGQLAFAGLAFTQATGFIPVQVNDPVLLEIFPEGNSDPGSILFSEIIVMTAQTNYRLMLSGIVSGTGYNPSPAFQFTVLEDAAVAAANGNCDILFFQGSTDLGEVDIADVFTTIAEWASNLTFGEFSENVLLSADDSYVIEMTESNGLFDYGQWLIPIENYNLSGEAAVIFTSGFVNPLNNSNGSAMSFFIALNNGEVYPIDIFFEVNDFTIASDIQLYPNPGNDIVFVKIKSDQSMYDVTISDVAGKIVAQQKLYGSMMGQFALDTAQLMNGVYTIFVQHTEGVLTERLVVKH